MPFTFTLDDHAYDYRASQLDLTDYWSMSAQENISSMEDHRNLPQLVLDWLRGQNRICRNFE